MEGLKSALTLTNGNILHAHDIIVLIETLTTKTLEINGYYSQHIAATQGPRGRPKRGTSCFFKPQMGKIISTYQDQDTLVINFANISVIAIYIEPRTPIEDLIAAIMTALRHAVLGQNIIIAGDLNCRIDVASHRTDELLDMMAEEGFTLVNKADQRTYFDHSGCSTIDLIFFKGPNITLRNYEVCYSAGEAPLKKHCPVAANFHIPKMENRAKTTTTKASRQLNNDVLNQKTNEWREFEVHIKENDMELAAITLEKTIQSTLIYNPKRRAQKWFDKECYGKRKTTLQALHTAKNTKSPEDIRFYNQSRKEYKSLLKTKRKEYLDQEATKMAEEARKDPYIALRPRKAQSSGKIDIAVWEEHFSSILNIDKTTKAYELVEAHSAEVNPFTAEEVHETIASLKNKKAPGPDGICNEHIKNSSLLLQAITDILNLCLRKGNIPEIWKLSTIKMLYKGKGDQRDPNSYRGIALEKSALKILTSVITKRITKETEHKIPEEQFGFRKGRSTLHAIKNLIDDIEDALRHPRGKFHAVFVDFTKAFDKLNRHLLITKLESIKGKDKLTALIHNMLAANFIQITDEVTTSKTITQTNGVLQGDPLSPLLFNIATYDAVQMIKQDTEGIKIYMYADDMVIGSNSTDNLQRATNQLENWAQENEMEINMGKTVQMTFRKGGRETKEDRIYLGKEPLMTVNSFKYLGLTLQTTTRSYRLHIRSRAAAATKAIWDIKTISRISLKTAMALFNAKIAPIATYGIELIWEKLSLQDLMTLEAVKSRFLKATLGVSRYTRSRLAYELAREPFFIEDLRMKLPSTDSSNKLLQEREKKRREIWMEFYATTAMTNRSWTEANQDLRHLVNSMAVHGYHHKICKNKCFHDPEENCVCEMCEQPCDRYHITTCKKRVKPLAELCKQCEQSKRKVKCAASAITM